MPDLGDTLREFFRQFDRRDFAAALRMIDVDAEGSDEITKRWIRGKNAFKTYVRRVGPKIRNIRTRLYNMRTRRMGNVGLVTYNAVQSYSLSGKRHRMTFVASTIFLKRGKNWKITLIHMTPL